MRSNCSTWGGIFTCATIETPRQETEVPALSYIEVAHDAPEMPEQAQKAVPLVLPRQLELPASALVTPYQPPGEMIPVVPEFRYESFNLFRADREEWYSAPQIFIRADGSLIELPEVTG